MAGVFNVSEMVSLALHSMVLMAGSDEKMLNVKQIAESTQSSEAHLAKVLQKLAKANLVRSVRGPKGGFSLNRDAEDITLLEVYETIEGPIVIERCSIDRSDCPFGSCIFGGIPQQMNKKFVEFMKSKALNDFVFKHKGE